MVEPPGWFFDAFVQTVEDLDHDREQDGTDHFSALSVERRARGLWYAIAANYHTRSPVDVSTSRVGLPEPAVRNEPGNVWYESGGARFEVTGEPAATRTDRFGNVISRVVEPDEPRTEPRSAGAVPAGDPMTRPLTDSELAKIDNEPPAPSSEVLAGMIAETKARTGRMRR